MRDKTTWSWWGRGVVLAIVLLPLLLSAYFVSVYRQALSALDERFLVLFPLVAEGRNEDTVTFTPVLVVLPRETAGPYALCLTCPVESLSRLESTSATATCTLVDAVSGEEITTLKASIRGDQRVEEWEERAEDSQAWARESHSTPPWPASYLDVLPASQMPFRFTPKITVTEPSRAFRLRIELQFKGEAPLLENSGWGLMVAKAIG